MSLNARYTKGITIEIGGNATKLKTALDTANRAIRTTQSELDALKNSLKLEWDASKFQRAQELAKRALEQTEQKADTLRKALKAMGDTSSFTDTQREQYEAIRRELSYVEVAAEKAGEELKSLNNLRLDQLKESISEAGRSLDSIGNKLTVGLTAPLAAAGAASVKYASDTEEAVNKVEVAFEYAAEGVKSWSDTTLTSYGLAKGTALDMAALFGDMATSMGYSRAEAAEMSKSLVGLAADLASFKNISIDEASTALKSIFTGETESLKNLGVVMTQTNLEAYAMAEGVETAYKDMDQAQQVAVRYQYVLSQTKNAQGDFARTSDSTANQLRILQESLKEAAATLGSELLPVVTPIIAQINELIQSFNNLDEGTRKAVVQAGLFVAALGPMMKLTGGVTQAVSAGITVYQSLKTALNAAATAQAGLNTVMNANPVGAVVTAVGTLVAVLGTLALTTALTTERTNEFVDSLKESQKLYEETSASIRQQGQDMTAMVAALDGLIAEEEKTEASKAAILDIVDQLNKAVPGLSLAYDEQTESLNMTTEALIAAAEAQVLYQQAQEDARRYAELQIEQEQITVELAEAQREYSKAVEEGAARTGHVSQAQVDWRDAINELTAAQEANAAEMERLRGQIDKTVAAQNRLNAGLEQAANTTDSVTESLNGLTTVLEKVEGSYEILTKAQKECDNSGSLSLDTLRSLAEKYPELTKYLVATADGYVLAEGALEDYMAAQQAEYQLAFDNAAAAAQTIVDAEADKLSAIGATTTAVKDQVKALAELYQSMGANAENEAEAASYYAKGNAYQDAYNELLQAEQSYNNYERAAAMLGRDYGSNTSGKGGSSSGTASKEKTQAERDLEAYEEAVEELDHLRAMDEISEEDYYRRKAALGEKYLTENLEQRRALDEELHEWQKGAYDRVLSALEEALEREKITTGEYLSELLRLRDEHLEEGSDAWEDATRKHQEEMQRINQEAYSEELADLEYFQDMGLVTEEEYYRALAQLRDKFLEEDSEAWRAANVKIYNYQVKRQEEALAAAQKAYEAQIDALEKAYNERLEELKDALEAEKDALEDAYKEQKEAAKAAYEEKKAAIQAELALEKERLNAVIDGIDAEIQARKELREDEEQDGAIEKARKRLEAAQEQLAYARTDEDRAEWEKEVVRLQEALQEAVQDKEDTAFYREKEAEKEAVKEQITAAEDAAKEQQEQASRDYEAALERLEDDYEAALEQAQAKYEEALKAAERAYQDAVSNVGGGGGSSGSGGAGGGRVYSDEVIAIAKANDVDRDVAYAMWYTNEKYKDDPDYVPYSDGGYSERAAEEASALGEMVGAVAAGAARAITREISNVTNNTNSASVTINEARALTEGEIERSVKKALNAMDR